MIGGTIGFENFNIISRLGKGNSATIMLAEMKDTGQLYAIKILNKEFIVENDDVKSIWIEKRVFLMANKERHPFLTNLHGCFQTETRICFVMEYIPGGDLMFHIQQYSFKPSQAQYARNN